jgi:hypothetical protein
MGLDIIPGISQVKSVVQLAFGDTEGARRTQDNFLKECPIVSQITSVVQLTIGDVDGAFETQKRCGKMVLNFADGIPVVGHAKGVIHYVVGDTEGGSNAMKSATRSAGVMAGGVAGFCVGGPAGAVAGGIYGGAVLDTTTSIITNKPSGYYAAIENIVKNPNPGDIFDTILMPVGDGLSGYVAGQTYNNLTTKTGNANSANSNSKGGTSNSGKGPSNGGGSAGGGSVSRSAGGVNVAEGQAMQVAAEADFAGRLNYGLECPPGMTEAQYMAEINKNAAMMKNALEKQGSGIPSVRPLKPPIVNTVQTSSSGNITAGSSSIGGDIVSGVTTIKYTELEENVKIISSNEKFTKILISLLEMNIKETMLLLKSIGIAWPFDQKLSTSEVAKIIFENCNVGNNNSIEAVDKWLKKRGKSASKDILLYLTELSEKAKSEKEEKDRHKRGEHVINNGVLKLHKDILDSFLSKRLRLDFNETIARIRFSKQIKEDYNEPVSSDVRNNIASHMVVHFQEDFIYINANSLIYGIAVYGLRSRCVSHMIDMFNNWPMRGNGTEHTASVRV